MKVMFTSVPEAVGTSIASYFSADFLMAIVSGILFCGVLQRLLETQYSKRKDTVIVKIAGLILPISVFIWSMLLLFTGSYSPSIYGAF